MQGLPPPVGGGCAPEQWVSPIVLLPQEGNPPLRGTFYCPRGTFYCPQVVGGYEPTESYKSLQCIIQRADNFDKLLWQSDYWTHPPLGGKPTVHGRWEPLHGGLGSISLEYQNYTSVHLFDTQVTGLGVAASGAIF